MSGNEQANRPDEALVRASLAGDEGAFRDLMERYKRRAFGVALGIVGDADDAQDVVQDAFVKAYYKLRDFRFGSNFFPRFSRPLVNQAIDRWRKTSRSVTVSYDDTWVSGETSGPEARVYPKTPEELAGNRELAEGISGAIAALPEHARNASLRRGGAGG